MCGFTGVIGPEVQAIKAGFERIQHRGPDAQGFWVGDLSWAKVALGQARLAIVDQRSLMVPYIYPSLGVVLAYNGEIYNWGELREELADGTPWESRCDAEVLARAWRRWGLACLDRFNGMFAFCLVDIESGVVLLARDRAGEKPLYWATRQGHLYFSSEIKGLACGPLEEVECLDMEVFEFDCLEATPFKDVNALLPGHYIQLTGGTKAPEPKCWWQPPRDVDMSMGWEEACAKTEALLVSSIRMRAQATVPVTAYVSGGLDSAIIQAVARLDHVFSYGSECPKFDAAGDAAVTVTMFDKDAAIRALPRIAWHLDTPATWSALAHWFLAKDTREHGFKVVLSGEGADELFGGYTRYRILWWVDQMRDDPNLARYGSLLDHMLAYDSDSSGDGFLVRMLDRSVTDTWEARERLENHTQAIIDRFGGNGRPMTPDMLRLDWHTTMQVLLRMADRMTMAHGIENRSPFFDHRLVEHAFRMPLKHKIDATSSKRVLREVARRLGVDTRIVDDKDKRGLSVPWNSWVGRRSAGSRGLYDRRAFADTMRSTWRRVWSSQGARMFENPKNSEDWPK